LVFARGTAKITDASEATLMDLSEKLKAWPQYYLIVKGHASSEGDVQANLKLASSRANSAVEWLASHGVDRNRIRAEMDQPNGSTTVAFILGELPY
jgi:OOP family OmpA-OmpF porin